MMFQLDKFRTKVGKYLTLGKYAVLNSENKIQKKKTAEETLDRTTFPQITLKHCSLGGPATHCLNI